MQKVEKQYHPTEELLRRALKALDEKCDGAIKRDGVGFNGGEAQSAVIKHALWTTYPYSVEEAEEVYKVALNHRKQLQNLGIEIPVEEDVQALVTRKKDLLKIRVEYREDFLWIKTPYAQKDAWQVFKETFRQRRDQVMPGYDLLEWTDNVNKEWRMTPSKEALALLLKKFPDAKLLESTVALRQKFIEDQKNEILRKAQEKTAAILEYNALIHSIENYLTGEFAPGKKLFPHQIDGIKVALKKSRWYIADKMGLGKTAQGFLCALAQAKVHNLKIIIITKKAARQDWIRQAAELETPVEVYTWRTVPEAGSMWPDFVLIADEFHYAKNVSAQRTKKMMTLGLHEKCKACYLLSGTPYSNGRPYEIYNAMLLCKHPLVWDEDSSKRYLLKRKFEERYCNRRQKLIGKNMFWDITGALNEEELHMYTMYKFDKEQNHEYAFMFQRQKDVCKDLPPKIRQMRECEISKEALQIYATTVTRLVDKFEANVEKAKQDLVLELRTAIKTVQEEERDEEKRLKKIKKLFGTRFEEKDGEGETFDINQIDFYIIKAVQEREESIRNAEMVVTENIFRHAGALAKVEATVEDVKDIIEQGDKVLIFTHFRDVVQALKEKIEKETGVCVGVVEGGQSEKESNASINDFQNPNGKAKIMICTAAGGDAITLTAAQYVILHDRPQRPGDAEQEEDRAHRIGQTGTVTVLWEQLPISVTAADIKNDQMLQEKTVHTNLLMQGVRAKGIKFHTNMESILLATAEKMRKYAKV